MIEMAIVGLGSWGLSGQISRDPSAILVNLGVWNWRVTPTLLVQWLDRKKALHAHAASDTGGDRLASALVSGDPIKLFGNGTNAQPGCSGAACNGGAGGAGGLASTGGNGGNTGDLALFGSGGAGGNGDPTFTINGGDAGAGAR